MTRGRRPVPGRLSLGRGIRHALGPDTDSTLGSLPCGLDAGRHLWKKKLEHKLDEFTRRACCITSHDHGDKLGAEVPVRGESARVRVQTLQVAGSDALLSREEVALHFAEVPDGALRRVFRH